MSQQQQQQQQQQQVTDAAARTGASLRGLHLCGASSTCPEAVTAERNSSAHHTLRAEMPRQRATSQHPRLRDWRIPSSQLRFRPSTGQRPRLRYPAFVPKFSAAVLPLLSLADHGERILGFLSKRWFVPAVQVTLTRVINIAGTVQHARCASHRQSRVPSFGGRGMHDDLRHWRCWSKFGAYIVNNCSWSGTK